MFIIILKVAILCSPIVILIYEGLKGGGIK